MEGPYIESVIALSDNEFFFHCTFILLAFLFINRSISNQAYANEVDLRMGPVSALKQPTFSSKGALQECATSIPVTQKKMITPTDLFESISTELVRAEANNKLYFK